MTATLIVVSHAATAATRASAFPHDEPVERAVAAPRLGRVDVVLRGPEARCAGTAAILGVDADVDGALRDADFGRWRGRSLDDVAAADPAAVAAWLTDPAAAPPDGESTVEVLARVAGWLDGQPDGRRAAAITHPAIVRALIVTALGAPPSAFWRIDVAPLSRTILRGGPGRWTLRWLTAGEESE